MNKNITTNNTVLMFPAQNFAGDENPDWDYGPITIGEEYRPGKWGRTVPTIVIETFQEMFSGKCFIFELNGVQLTLKYYKEYDYIILNPITEEGDVCESIKVRGWEELI